jgi:hypothetical protein
MSMDIEQVLGPQRPEGPVPVLPIPGAWAASNDDEVEEDAAGVQIVSPVQGGRSSGRVRKAVNLFDPSPAKKARVEPPPPPPIPEGERGAALERIRMNLVGQRSYLAANEILLPIAMRQYDADAASLVTVNRTALDDFFTKGLTDVCDSVFGPRLTKRLATEFSSKNDTPSIRNFFELMAAGPQCVGVLSEIPDGSAIFTHCWICGGKTDDKDNPKECEHRFSILPALVVTGLYDSRLRKALGEAGMRVYQPQLVSEYAYAHRRCNQVKSDDVFASLAYVGNNPRRVQCVATPRAIEATLNNILTRVATTYTPQPDTLRALVQAGPLWDGTSPTATDPGTLNDASWISARTQRIGQSMEAAAAKFNAKQLPALVVKTHIVNAMLSRAIEISPRLVQEELWNTLSDEGKALVTQSLKGRTGGRRRTPTRRRKGTRRAMRGGAEDEIWVDIVSSLVKESRVMDLVSELERRFRKVSSPDDYTAVVMDVFTEHVRKTDEETNRILSGMEGGTWDELLASIERNLVTQSGGPILRGISSARLESAGPIPPPVNTSLPATLTFGDAIEYTSGEESQMSTAVLSPPRTATTASPIGSPSGTPPPRPSGSASGLGTLVSPQKKGGFFALGTRPKWL